MSFVRIMSRGARKTPAIPAADTATKREFSGEGEESMSMPPAAVGLGDSVAKEMPGSGMANNAARKDRRRDVRVDRRRECTYVLFVPFQIPQAPSVFHTLARQDRTEDDECRSRA